MKTKTITKVVIISLIVCIATLAGGYGAYRGYKYARQVRLVKQARAFVEKQDDRKALLCLRRALRYNGRDVEACRLMAQVAEAARSPSALLWRTRVVELKPHSLDDRLALAQLALRLRDYASATNALDGVDAAGKRTASYHNIAGLVAVAANQWTEAEGHFVEASRLEPANAAPQLNLAVVRLQSTNASALADARSSLSRIASNPTNAALRCQAWRELAGDALRHSRREEALRLSQQLLQDTNSVFSDRLLRLEVLRELKHPDFESTLKAIQLEAASDNTNFAKVYELATWQMTRTTPRETLVWLQSLPLGMQTNLPVTLLIAEGQIAQKNWRGLEIPLQKQSWGELDFLRHAYLARAQREQNLVAGAKGEWELALKASNNQKGNLTMLLRLAAQWNWQSEGEELLWTIYNRDPEDKAAFLALVRALHAGGRTRPLMSLFSQELKRSPANLALKNDLAVAALLLDASEMKPHELAREVYEKSPTNAAFASTYAFSLHLQKKNAEALAVMRRLTPGELNDPSVAGYYGVILKAAGEKEKAKAYLGWAFKKPMLPEEEKLFRQAQAGI